VHLLALAPGSARVLKGHPRGLKILRFTEMWERFGSDLRLGILMQLMLDTRTGGLGLSRGAQGR
jgi:POT family proton-dependent oligopeptide transporter